MRGRHPSRRPRSGRTFLAAAEIEGLAALRHSLGYSVANEVMAAICARVAEQLDNCDVGRAGRASIDFAFTARSREEAHGRLMGVAAAAGHKLSVDGFAFDLPLTIGVTEAGVRAGSEMLELAEAALAEAQQRRLRVFFAEDAAPEGAVERLALARDLQKTIENDEFRLAYQPKVRTRTGLVDSAEALLRWHHPQRGPVPPSLFIPLAEEMGAVRPLTEWVIERAIIDAENLRADGCDVIVNVNISANLLADLNFAAWALARLGRCHQRIGFEITETAMIRDPEGALRSLRLFAEAGIHLSIDDYGSGFSSLAYLQKLPVNEIKIDQGFVTGLATSQRDPLLVRSTIDLAHALGMEVTAEGVEAPEVLALLQVMGCDLVQGYLVSRPVERDAFREFYRAAQAEEGRLLRRIEGPRFRLAARA